MSSVGFFVGAYVVKLSLILTGDTQCTGGHLVLPWFCYGLQCRFWRMNRRFVQRFRTTNCKNCTPAIALIFVSWPPASFCGFTNQFAGLEKLHQRYAKEGLVVVGFASNDFHQEAETEAEAATICFKNFGVTFIMIAPGPVTGEGATPVFAHINRQSSPPRWNFTKYLLNDQGKVVNSCSSGVRPGDRQITQAVESLW